MGEETENARGLEARLVVRLLGYLRPYAFWVLAGGAALLAGVGVRQAGPYLTKIGVDDYCWPATPRGSASSSCSTRPCWGCSSSSATARAG